jgi:hypothetical protein
MTKTLCKNRARVLHNGSRPSTCCLPKGLRVEADADHDGWVTTSELYDHVKKNVSDATNEVQVPVLRGLEK